MNIITNNHERQFLYGYEVPEAVLADYEHLDSDESIDHWIKYRGAYYHLSDFIRFDGSPDPVEDWHGCYSLTAFSAVFLRISEWGETYQIGLALS